MRTELAQVQQQPQIVKARQVWPAGAANQRRRPRPPNVPNALPVRAPALVRDPILPDRDIIFEEIRDGPVGAENQRPRPRNVPNPLAIPAPALVGDQILPDIIFDGIHEGQAGAANQRRRPRRRNVHRPPNFVHPLNRRPGTPPPPDFFSEMNKNECGCGVYCLCRVEYPYLSDAPKFAAHFAII
ncbi:hypothetical protein L5515_009662 [Caenorhabditis briggsae]|uniref:Uncharacterized protein n=1 Tax=Caenorhabditis briggsae TaxID=6238 RepID=A0AAE9F8R5_CAEBR|nr:hypothetical protein L5515_009662 [Caenorhabditis briggsae]